VALRDFGGEIVSYESEEWPNNPRPAEGGAGRSGTRCRTGDQQGDGVTRRRIPKGPGAKVSGLFKRFVPGFRKAEYSAAHHRPHAPAARHDLPDNPRIRSSGSRDVGNPSPEDVAAYNRIRANPHDTPRIAQNTGLPQNVLDRAKRHLFLDEHRVQMGPHTTEVGRFTPDKRVADLWEKAERGTLSPQEHQQFKKLMAHEYVEANLMDRGLPYRSDHPDYWNHPDYGPGVGVPSAAHHGAHDLAPNEGGLGPFSHYGRMGRDVPDVSIADDLSNLDDVIESIWRGGR
jgi:hypothetical protein